MNTYRYFLLLCGIALCTGALAQDGNIIHDADY